MTFNLLELRDRLLGEERTRRGRAFSDAWTSVVDAWLAEQFGEAVDAGSAGDQAVALVAVGGYGRGELAPGSDLDLLLLYRGRNVPAEIAEALWYPIWDEGLKLGHAVRTVADAIDLAADDLDTATALLSARYLAGAPALTEELAEAADAQWAKRSKRYLATLREGVADRQAQAGEVAFLLEPDLKEGRGGLRDIHCLRWAEQARAVLEDGDLVSLAAAEAVLFDARVALHRSTGRATDRLALQDQDVVAEELGHSADELMAAIANAGRTVAWIADEAWGRVAAALSSSVSLLGWRSRAQAPGLVVRDGQVLLEPDVDPASRPEIVLDAALLAATKHARLARATHARLAQRVPPPPAVWSPGVRERFVRLLGCGHATIGVIEALDHTGMWERYLPEWPEVRNRPQRNAYHRFTVDRHLLEATANAAALVDRVERPDLLLLGTLLHDIGKGQPGDHTAVGMEMVRTIGVRMGLDHADTEILVDLVRLHLLLPDTATRRDLADPTTIELVANEVGDVGRLHLLAALTEADSLATGPAAWSAWKADLVSELVRRVEHYFEGGDPAALSTLEFPDAVQRALLTAGELVVRGDGNTLTVVAPDHSGLFARMAGVLALHGLEVRAADAVVVDDLALEVFRVESRFGPTIAWDRVIAHLHAALAGRLAIEARLAEQARTYAPSVRASAGTAPPSVRFDDAASGSATVVEIQARDRVGLLYRVARAFGELDLDVRTAKIQTVGELVVDSFYITHTDSRLVTDLDLRRELERSLLHAVS